MSTDNYREILLSTNVHDNDRAVNVSAAGCEGAFILTRGMLYVSSYAERPRVYGGYTTITGQCSNMHGINLCVQLHTISGYIISTRGHMHVYTCWLHVQ